MNPARARFAAAACLVLALAMPFGNAFAQSARSVAGMYTLVSTDAFGKNPRGVLVLGADGRYSTIVMRASLPKFASGSRLNGAADETKGVVDGSLSHFGTYTVDDGGKTITFHIEAATFANWDGATQKRPLKVSGDTLTYTVTAPSGGGQGADTVWKRVK